MKRRKRRKKEKYQRNRFKFKLDIPRARPLEIIGDIYDLSDIEEIENVIEKFHGDRRKKSDT